MVKKYKIIKKSWGGNQMQAYVTSGVGMTRNQWRLLFRYPGDEVQLFIIADGMGGYNGEK